MPAESFELFFQHATKSDAHPAGLDAFPYQRKLATTSLTSRLIDIPTGCGKTAAVVLSWLWRRRIDPGGTPRRFAHWTTLRTGAMAQYRGFGVGEGPKWGN